MKTIQKVIAEKFKGMIFKSEEFEDDDGSTIIFYFKITGLTERFKGYDFDHAQSIVLEKKDGKYTNDTTEEDFDCEEKYLVEGNEFKEVEKQFNINCG